eukprot:792236-Heterocapsa_arctica.AAC.1
MDAYETTVIGLHDIPEDKERAFRGRGGERSSSGSSRSSPRARSTQRHAREQGAGDGWRTG